jgi:sulfur relay (sulfurtransferase) DsrC/TusE family protein
MTSPVLATLKLDAEGFMTDKSQWTKEIAEAMAQQEGIE